MKAVCSALFLPTYFEPVDQRQPKLTKGHQCTKFLRVLWKSLSW